MKNILEWVRMIVISVVIAFLITQLIKPTIIKEHSMLPTLNENNYIILSKMAYFFDNEPKFQDIVVFKSEFQTNNGKDKFLVKRVIGVEGDIIDIYDGNVYRNGELLLENYINGDFTPGDVFDQEVAENKLFVMGDNRPNSLDSRDESVGQVDVEEVVGKAVLRLYPFDEIGFIK